MKVIGDPSEPSTVEGEGQVAEAEGAGFQGVEESVGGTGT